MTDTVACRICLEDTGELISPCGCKGSTANVHEECLRKWVRESGSEVCEICQEEYAKHDIVSCNLTNYYDGLFRSSITSDIEGNLLKLTALHSIFAMCMYSWSNVDYWMFMTSIQTVVHSLSLIMFQIYHHNLDFFVLRVMIYWSTAYLFSVLIIGTIRTMDNSEQCAINCFKFSKLLDCTDQCIVYDYYHRKDITIGNVIIVRCVELLTLVCIRCVAICFTHMKRSEYYSFRRNDDVESSGASTTSATGMSEESSPLLSC